MKIFETGFLRLFVHDSYKSLFDNLYNIRGIANICDCIYFHEAEFIYKICKNIIPRKIPPIDTAYPDLKYAAARIVWTG